MSFLKTLIERFRKIPATATAPKAEVEDIFAARLRKMQGRNRAVAQSSPFKTARQHQAA